MKIKNDAFNIKKVNFLNIQIFMKIQIFLKNKKFYEKFIIDRKIKNFAFNIKTN